MNTDVISSQIKSLIFDWFPFLKTVVLEGGSIFGGVIREMWIAGLSHTRKSSYSLEDTIRQHMFYYFQNGGDVDFQVTRKNESIFNLMEGSSARERKKYPNTWRNQSPIPEELLQIQSIVAVASSYEMQSIVRGMNNDAENGMGYGLHHDEPIVKSRIGVNDAFPMRHYKIKALALICPQLGSAMKIDMDMIERISCNAVLNCDFVCNFLELKASSNGESMIEVFPRSINTFTVKDCIDQISKKELYVFDTKNPVKLIYRMCMRIKDGWTLNRNAANLKKTGDIFIRAMIQYGNDSSMKSEDLENKYEMQKEYIHDGGDEIMYIFNTCSHYIRCILINKVNEHVARGNTDFPYTYREFMCIIQTFFIKHGKFYEFKEWSSQIPRWDINSYYRCNMRNLIEYRPDLVPSMFKEFPIKNNGDAIRFMCSLIEFDRKSLFMQFLNMKSGIRTIEVFNSLSDKDKLESSLIGLMFRGSIWSSHVGDVSYLKILCSKKVGLILPDMNSFRNNGIHIQNQSTELLKFLWDEGLITKRHLFPTADKESWRYRDAVNPTTSNLRWILSLANHTRPLVLSQENVRLIRDNFKRDNRIYADESKSLFLLKQMFEIVDLPKDPMDNVFF